ncbi:MAG: glycoside hydrolase family 3 N-terminal domain-containing protein [Bacillota bacterium]|nr:glycoside hydrolase family 3 N-terminal domain-containing protein [Bacillota bacterium]
MKIRTLVILIIIMFLLLIVGAFLLIKDNLPQSGSGVTLSDVLERDRDPDVEALLEEMTLDEKVGQMFMGCFYGGTPSPETVSQYHLGSVLFFKASFENSDMESFKASLDAIDEASAITPIAAVDEEGGTVVRVSGNAGFREKAFQSPRDLFDAGGMDAVIDETHEKNALLSEMGIDLNLAPVCDISTDPADFMYPRSLGQSAEVTSQFATETVKACLEDNMGCSLKHFPGYGNAADTHNGFAIDARSLEQLESNDFLPFAAGIEAGAPSVLVSHNIVRAIDGERPASLSPAIHNILRYDMKFDGVIITDDLSMGAIADYYPEMDGAVAAVIAGNDILCTGDFRDQYGAVLDAVKGGIISEERIDQSVRRILNWKKDLGLLESRQS